MPSLRLILSASGTNHMVRLKNVTNNGNSLPGLLQQCVTRFGNNLQRTVTIFGNSAITNFGNYFILVTVWNMSFLKSGLTAGVTLALNYQTLVE